MGKIFEKVQDSGERQEFETGAHRDIRIGKGRFDLLPFNSIRALAEYLGRCSHEELKVISYEYHVNKSLEFVNNFSGSHLQSDLLGFIWHSMVLIEFQETDDDIDSTVDFFDRKLSDSTIPENTSRYDLIPPKALIRIAKHFENGAVKYTEDNWRQGIPLVKYMDSEYRHAIKVNMGFEDEDHYSAAAWNALCLLDTWIRLEAGHYDEATKKILEFKKEPTLVFQKSNDL
jgi:hypothetical protein